LINGCNPERLSCRIVKKLFIEPGQLSDYFDQMLSVRREPGARR
jgi:hypothetical protein